MQGRQRVLARQLYSLLQSDTLVPAARGQQLTSLSTSATNHILRSPLGAINSVDRSSSPSNPSRQSSNKAVQAAAVFAFGVAATGALLPTAHALDAEPHTASIPAVQDVVTNSASEVTAKADVYELPKETRGLPKDIVLFQYDVCPFCCKLKAVLDFYKMPYTCVEVGPLFKTELKWSEKYKKVPVVMLDGEVIVDSSAIISRIAAEQDAAARAQSSLPALKRGWFERKAAGADAHPSVSSHTEEETRWRKWVDSRLVRVLTINIYRTRQESFQTFDYITQQGNFSWAEREFGRIFGAAMMWMVSGRLKKKYDMMGDSRQELYDSAAQWVAAIGQQPFLGGNVPNLADLSAFGAIRSITETDTFMDLMHNTDISEWYERMMKAVGPSARKNPPKSMLV